MKEIGPWFRSRGTEEFLKWLVKTGEQVEFCDLIRGDWERILQKSISSGVGQHIPQGYGASGQWQFLWSELI